MGLKTTVWDEREYCLLLECGRGLSIDLVAWSCWLFENGFRGTFGSLGEEYGVGFGEIRTNVWTWPSRIFSALTKSPWRPKGASFRSM